MQQFDIDNQNFNLQLELQYIRARNRQRRRRVLIMGLAAFSILYVLLQPNQYEKSNSIPYSQNNTIDTPTQNEINQTLVLIQKHFTLLEKLLISQFEGNWTDSSNQGISQGNFFKNSYQTHMQIQFQLKLIQGSFLEDDYYYFSFYLTSQQLQLTTDDNIFNFTNVKTSYRQSNVYQNDQFSQEAISNITIKLDNFINNNSTIEKSLNNVQMTLNIEYCLKENIDQCQFQKIQFQSILQYKNIDNKAIIYSTIVSILNVIQFISCLKLMKDFINESRQANQFSLFIFVFLMIFDGYLGIIHFFLALQSEYYLTPAFLELVLFFFLELKLAMHIWKERFISLQDNLNIRRELYKFYIKFYLFAMILVLLLYYFIYYNLFLILVNLYLIPQIIHVAYQGQYVDFDKMFVFGLLATRLFIPLYFRGCPYNVLHSQVSYFTCIIIVLLFIAQTILYYFQCTIGPRFFLPKWLKPKTHDYFIDQSRDGECAICITHLNDQPTETALDNKYIARIISINSNKLMETPCGHHFHAICLTKWMNVKLNCPTCRSVLPPLI